mmetsp:Transcript_83492/g.244774  ORF Transcript_83492/g.244774 Transcript_83492/m.244774 type:complete len:179 (+) Transcript_83492:260-796(+)
MPFAPQMDGNLNFVLQGNEGWLSAVTLTTLVDELRTLLASQQFPHPLGLALGNGRRTFCQFAVAAFVWFAAMVALGGSVLSAESTMLFSLLPIAGFGGLLCLGVWAFTRVGSQRRQLLAAVETMARTLQSFAEAWSSRPENAMLDLTYKTGMTDPSYFELSPAAAMAVAGQALYPSAP